MTQGQNVAPSHRRMRSVRSLLVVAATIAAFTILAPTASASTDRHNAFHLAKVCSADGSTCTVTDSNFRAIPVGTTITYAATSVYPSALIPTINAPHGSATGLCDLSALDAGTGPGSCVFTGGTGSLRHFRIDLDVTFDGAVWYWDAAPCGHGHNHR